MREPPRGDRSVHGDHKEAMVVTTRSKMRFKDEILPHSGREEQKGNRGRGILRKWREGETART